MSALPEIIWIDLTYSTEKSKVVSVRDFKRWGPPGAGGMEDCKDAWMG